MRLNENRRTYLGDLQVHQPGKFQTAPQTRQEIKNDKRPLQFTSPLYSPLTPDRFSIVQQSKDNDQAGFFGMTRKEEGSPKAHKGLDLEASDEEGFRIGVTAAEAGIVSYAGWAKGYGQVIYLDHRDGYQTRYAHLNEIHVKPGQLVGQGALIGETGKTGNAAGSNILSHLHFEIRKDGVAVDPLPLLTEPRADRKLFLMIEGLNKDTN